MIDEKLVHGNLEDFTSNPSSKCLSDWDLGAVSEKAHGQLWSSAYQKTNHPSCACRSRIFSTCFAIGQRPLLRLLLTCHNVFCYHVYIFSAYDSLQFVMTNRYRC